MFVKGHPPHIGPGRPKGRLNNKTIEAKALARQLVNDSTYRQNLLQWLQTGEAGAMEALLWHYAFGKPKDQVEMKWNLEKLSGESPIILNRHISSQKTEVINCLGLGRRPDKSPCLMSGNSGFGIFKDSFGEPHLLKQTPSGHPKAVQYGPVSVDVFGSDQRDDLHGELIEKVRSPSQCRPTITPATTSCLSSAKPFAASVYCRLSRPGKSNTRSDSACCSSSRDFVARHGKNHRRPVTNLLDELLCLTTSQDDS